MDKFNIAVADKIAQNLVKTLPNIIKYKHVFYNNYIRDSKVLRAMRLSFKYLDCPDPLYATDEVDLVVCECQVSLSTIPVWGNYQPLIHIELDLCDPGSIIKLKEYITNRWNEHNNSY